MRASFVAAYGKWKQLGRTVNKGEKGIAILATMVFKNVEKSEDESDEETTVGFKAVYVFDFYLGNGCAVLTGNFLENSVHVFHSVNSLS